MKKLLFTLFLLLGTLALGAKVKLPALVGDNMMLQQQTDARLWGWAEPGATVRVTPSWDGQTVTCQADAKAVGWWACRRLPQVIRPTKSPSTTASR